MRYTVTQSNRRLTLNDEQGQYLGVMDFNFWKPSNGNVTTPDGSVYDTVTTGFWQNKKLINKNGQPFAEIHIKATKGFIITFVNGPTYRFHKKKFWSWKSSEFILTDSADSTVAQLHTTFKWKKFNFQYNIDINEALLDRSTTMVMPYLLAYCIRMMHQRQSSSGALFPIIINR